MTNLRSRASTGTFRLLVDVTKLFPVRFLTSRGAQDLSRLPPAVDLHPVTSIQRTFDGSASHLNGHSRQEHS